jgi:hypothetical protein
MGYACPVCETPQQDAEHLANHMAITGMVRDQAHADWLDDHVEGWQERSPAEVGAALADDEAVQSVDYDRAAADHADLPADAEFADEGHGHDHSHGHGHAHEQGHDHAHDHTHRGPAAGVDAEEVPEQAEMADADDLDDDVEAIIEEARELTRQQFEDAAVEEDADDTDAEE